MSTKFGKALREPLVIFLLLGGSLFLLSEWQSLGNGDNLQASEIMISEGRIEAIAAGFQKVWKRSPTSVELDALIEDFIKEEVLYREALTMQLDKNDPIVRRRMRQKIEFLGQDLANANVAEDQTLQKHMEDNPEEYLLPERYSFQQVFLNPQKHGANFEEIAQKLLLDLRQQNIDAALAGDRLLIDLQFNNLPEPDIQRAFGIEFTQTLASLPVGQWSGPV